MDINEVTDELYGLEPADFVEIRTARAKQARADGDRALANKIAALRRPTTVAWMVNILARERAEDALSKIAWSNNTARSMSLTCIARRSAARPMIRRRCIWRRASHRMQTINWRIVSEPLRYSLALDLGITASPWPTARKETGRKHSFTRRMHRDFQRRLRSRRT